MSCTIKTKSLNRLKELGVISKTREILDFKRFNELNDKYTKRAIEKYDLPTNGKLLFDVVSNTVDLGKGNRIRPRNEKTIFRAEPNNKLFDLFNDIIVDYKNNHTKDNTNFESKNLGESIKEGVDSIFESNPELANAVYEALGFKTKSEMGVSIGKDLLSIEENEIPKKEGESFSEMQVRVKQNINIRKRIEIANKNNIKQGKLYSFLELESLLNNSIFDNDIYNDLRNILPQITFRFGSLNKVNKKTNGYYDSINNTINLEILHLTNSDFKRTLLHEIIHAATFINLQEDFALTDVQKTALNNLNNLIEELKKDRDFFGEYGLTNANELLAELANKNFVNKLKKKIFSDNQSFFEKIISEIVRLLGLNTTAYDIVKESFDSLVKEYKSTNQITPQQKATAQQQYSQYLDTVFPDSKVKDIVYRGGNITKEEFADSEHTPTDYMDLGIGLYLSPNIDFAKNYGKPRAIIVNIKNPKDTTIAHQERVEYGQKEGNYGIPQLDSEGKYDGIVDLSQEFNKTYELVVFEPEQIHILGSKQDIEGFKNYKNNTNLETKDLEETTEKRIEDLLDEKKDNILFGKEESNIEEEIEVKSENFNDFILFNSQDGPFTAKDVLNNIKTNFKDFNKSSLEIIDKLIPILESTNAKIKFVTPGQLSNKDTTMEYKPSSNEIRISKEVLNTISEEFAVRAFLHEVVHSITVDAYSKPQTIEAQMFRDFIDEMYEKYKDLSGYEKGDKFTSRNYGFSNKLEFIAEIMTNPKFQAKIKDLEGGIKKGMWSKFIDYIRTLLGLRKNSDYHNIIENITNIAKDSDYNGGLSLDRVMFEKKKTEESEDDIKDKRYVKLRTIQDRLTFTLDKIKDNLDQNIANYEHLIKITKDTEKIEHYKGKLEELLESLESLDKTEEWKGIGQYTTQLLENISQLERRFRSEDLSVEEADKTIHLYNKYLQSNSLIEPVQRLISDARREKDLPITQSEIEDIQKALDEASGKYNKIRSDIGSFNRSAAVNLLNDRLYAPEVLFKWREKLKKEHKQLGINENVTSWVSRQMNTTYKDEVDADVLENAQAIVEDPSFDISAGSKLFDAALNTNNELVQVTQSVIDKMRNNIVQEKLALSLELQSLFEEFTKEKGDGIPSNLYKNMYEEDSEGNIFLKGEYSVKFKEEYDKTLAEHREELAEVLKEFGENSTQYKNFYGKSKFKKWKDTNLKEITEGDKKRVIPVDKWKTDLSGMSEIEVKVLKKAREVFEKSNYQTYRIRSLISPPFYGVKTYSLPAITANNLENILEGKGKELVKDKIKDLTSIRLDDVGFEETYTDINGNPVRNVKVHFRGKMDKGQQSLDLFSLMALEGYNGINFRNKQDAESDLQMLLDIAKDKTYYRRKGLTTQLLSRNNSRIKAVPKAGEESNVYKRLQSLMEINIYDILHKNVGAKLGPVDINKAVGMANGYTALIGLSVSEVAATANVMNGKAQMFLEGIAGNYMSFGAIAKAEAKYFTHLPEMFKDINKPVSTSYINQLTDMYDTYGAISVSMKQAFIKNGILKSNLNIKSLQFMQDSGEHWMQSVLTMAVLEDIKVMDKDSNFIDKDGNIVKDKKKAASLLDMTKMVDGKLTTDSKVVYTTKTIGIEFNKGGKEMIMKLVKKKVFDTAGVYDSNMQPEAMRHFQFKLIMMFRKYLVSMGLARYRGFIHINKKLPELEKHEVFFSHALQDYETGTHTETARFIFTGIRDAFEQKKFSILKENWNELTDTQRKQIAKSVSELVIMFALLPALTMLLGAMGGDDDDDGVLAFFMLQTVRLQSELRSFMSINDQWRLIQSPIPSLRVLESGSDLIFRILQPWDWNEEIKGGKNKGNLRIWKNTKDLVPIWSKTGRTYKEYRTYIENQALY